MQKYKILLVLFAVFCALSFAVLAARAEEAAALPVTDATAAQALAESVSLADEAETLDGVQLTEPKNIPSGFGFWWNDLKENISLALTFNPVKKAEKQLQFAAQRVKLAEYMTQNSTDTKVQEKARQLLTRANEYMEKIQERKNELAQNVNQEKVQVLLRNAAKHQVNAQRVFEELEDKLPAEKLEAWQQWRQQIEVRQQQFLEELKTDVALPQELKDKAAEIKARIEAKIQNREEFRAQQEEILDEIKAGKEEAKAALEELRKERQQLVGPAREQYQETKSEIIDKINSGDQEAVKELIQLNQARKTEVKKIQQEVKVKAVEIKTEVKNTIEENRQELQQNRVEQKIENRAVNKAPAGAIKPAVNPVVKPAATPLTGAASNN